MRVSWSEARSLRFVRGFLAFLGIWIGFAAVATELSAGAPVSPWLAFASAIGIAASTGLASAPASAVLRFRVGGRVNVRAWVPRISIATAVFVVAAVLHRSLWDATAIRVWETSGHTQAISDFGGSTVAVAFLLAAQSVLYRLPREPADVASPRGLAWPEAWGTLRLPLLAFLAAFVTPLLLAAALPLFFAGSVSPEAFMTLGTFAFFLAVLLGLTVFAARGMWSGRSRTS